APRAALPGAAADRRARSSEIRAVGVEIDDDVGEADVEALAGAVDDAPLEPVRAAGRVRRDDQLVGLEGADRVLDRLQRVAVADLPLGVEAVGAHRLEAAVQPRLRGRTRVVL